MNLELLWQEVEHRRQCQQWGVPTNNDEAWLAHLLLTFCCVVQSLAGGRAGWLGTPDLEAGESESESLSAVSDSLRPHGLYSPCSSPGQNTGVGSLSVLQGIFPNQG